MAFNNPIATQTQAGASAPAVVQNDTTQVALSGISNMLGFLGDYQTQQARAAAANQPEAWQVKEEWETEGAQEALRIAEKYKLMVQTDGRAKAELWLNKNTIEVQHSMGATAGDKFQAKLVSLIGKNSDIDARDAEMERKNAREAEVDKLEVEGMELVAANAAAYGLDPAKVTRDDYISIGLVTRGQKSQTALTSAQNAVMIQQQGMVDRERKLTSQAVAVQTSAGLSNDVRVALFTASEMFKQKPNEVESIKANTIAQLELKKSQMQNAYAQSVGAAGGNIADVDNSLVTGSIAQVDAAINLLRGDFQVQQMQTTLNQMSLGTTLNVIGSLPTASKQQLLVTNQVKVNMPIMDNMIKSANANQFDPNAYVEVINNLDGLGAAAARQRTNVPVEKAYRLVYDLNNQAVGKPEYHEEAANSLTNTLFNSYMGTSTVRKDANSARGLPVLLADMAKNPKLVELAPAIEAAAAKEGTTVNEMFVNSVSGLFRESVYPSLSVEDPYVIPNLDIQYTNGKFSVALKEQEYRTQSKLERNVLPHSGRDLSNDKINVINQRLKTMQGVLNNAVLSYKNLGGNPDDFGAAMKYQLEVSSGISGARMKAPVEVSPPQDTLVTEQP